MEAKKNIIVFAPHPDDETLGCGGTIAKKTREGYAVFIALLTDGRHAFSKVLGIESDPSPEELKKIRKGEVIRAAKILGVASENIFFLDFEDTKLENDQTRAEEKISELLKKLAPVEVYFTHPRDANVDHRTANRIVQKCLRDSGLPCTNFQFSILNKYSRIGPVIERLLGLFKNNAVEVDVSEFLDLKKKAIEEYKSQFSIISAKQNRPVERNPNNFLKTEEKFYIAK